MARSTITSEAAEHLPQRDLALFLAAETPRFVAVHASRNLADCPECGSATDANANPAWPWCERCADDDR